MSALFLVMNQRQESGPLTSLNFLLLISQLCSGKDNLEPPTPPPIISEVGFDILFVEFWFSPKASLVLKFLLHAKVFEESISMKGHRHRQESFTNREPQWRKHPRHLASVQSGSAFFLTDNRCGRVQLFPSLSFLPPNSLSLSTLYASICTHLYHHCGWDHS